MFTGIVEEIGHVKSIRNSSEGVIFEIAGTTVLEGTQLGDSIAVNGTCLTVTHLNPSSFLTGVSPETRKRTNLESLALGSRVNLERACTPSTRLGGHIVQGHVDGVGTLHNRRMDQEALWLEIAAPPDIMRYVVPKGFICLDGTSLTVVDVTPHFFSIMLVPYTQAHIVLPDRKPGDLINIEVDIIGKYVEKFLAGHIQSPANAITADYLKEHGFGS